MEQNRYYPIKAVSELTGLNHHIIRKWEQRYGAVTPHRTETNRRLYSEEDVERLQLLKMAIEQGHTIGHAVTMDSGELSELIRDYKESKFSGKEAFSNEPAVYKSEYHYEECVNSVKQLDPLRLRSSLHFAEHLLSKRIVLEKVVIPLLRSVGTLWEKGVITIAQEHTALAVIRTYIGNMETSLEIPENAPVVVVASPAGQRHEIGALIAAITAMTEGWNAVYLGADLPAEEILNVSRSRRAQMIAISLIYPENDSDTRSELTILIEGIDKMTFLIAGGNAAHSYRDLFAHLNTRLVHDFDEFRLFLQNMKNIAHK